MVNFSDVVKSLNFAWVNRYCKAPDSHWCALLDSILHKVGGAFLFQCNYDLKLLDLKNLPAFYKIVLAVWQELNSRDPIDTKEIQQEIQWNNRFITISGKSIYYKTWVNRSILKVCNLLDTHARVISFVLKTLNINLEFAVLFSIMLVFLLQFLNFGRAKS